MSYIFAARDFFVEYDLFVLPLAFLLVWTFGIVNFCKNTYRRDNKKINACRSKLLKNNSQPSAVMYAAPLPYRRQWRAFVASGAQKPSLTFEFVPRKNRKTGVFLVVFGALLSAAYLAIFVFDVTHREYAVFQAAFFLSLAVVLVVNRLLFKRKEKRARQSFGKLVAQLNAIVEVRGLEAVTAGPDKQTVAQQIKNVKKSCSNKDALKRASEILRKSGLNGTRTANEQRQINYALNGLLQTYSKNGTLTF